MILVRILLLLTLICSTASIYAEPMLTQPLRDVVFYPQHSAPAIVIAKHNSQLSVEVNGIVRELLVDVGDTVATGDAMLRLDDFSFRQLLRQADAAIEGLQARIVLAEYQLAQAQRLDKQNNIAEELLRQRQAELTSLNAELSAQQAQRDQAQRNLESSVLRAPFAGVVVERQAQLGQFARPGEPLMQLLSGDGQQVGADLQRDDAAVFSKASQLMLRLNRHSFKVKLDTVLPVLDPQTRTQQVRLDFIDEVALAGSSGRLLWQDHRPYLPATFLQRRGGKLGIFIVEQGEAIFVALPDAQEGRATRVDHLQLDSQLVKSGAATFDQQGR